MAATNAIIRVHEEGVLAADDDITPMAVEYAHEDSLSTENQSEIDFDGVISMAPITNALGDLSFEQQDDYNNLDDDALQDWDDFWLQQQMELGLIP